MFEIFILFMGTAITLTVGKIIWDCSQNREDDKNEC